jgi:hypothetical protein
MSGRHALRRTSRARLTATWQALRAAWVDSPETVMVAVALLVLAALVIGEAM